MDPEIVYRKIKIVHFTNNHNYDYFDIILIHIKIFKIFLRKIQFHNLFFFKVTY